MVHGKSGTNLLRRPGLQQLTPHRTDKQCPHGRPEKKPKIQNRYARLMNQLPYRQ